MAPPTRPKKPWGLDSRDNANGETKTPTASESQPQQTECPRAKWRVMGECRHNGQLGGNPVEKCLEYCGRDFHALDECEMGPRP